LDIDMTNSFHQFPLTTTSSQRLAIQSPWGLVEPLFLTEGVSPASGHFQWTMMQMVSRQRLETFNKRYLRGYIH